METKLNFAPLSIVIFSRGAIEEMKLTKTHSLIGAFFGAITVACSFFVLKAHVNGSDEKPHLSNWQTTNGRNTYKEAIAKIDAERAALASEYEQANTQAKKNRVIDHARNVITRSIVNDLFPFWYGTDWDFSGVTETPNQGKIACGYFVSTLLRDAGWKVERVRLAQQTSENIISSLTTESHVRRNGPGRRRLGKFFLQAFTVIAVHALSRLIFRPQTLINSSLCREICYCGGSHASQTRRILITIVLFSCRCLRLVHIP